jgi:3-hydroxyisobutyrate dehydrogenase
MNERPRIGFIGLGIMGRPMVKNLLKAGYDVTVWNRSRPGIDDAVAAGAKEAASAKDVAVQTDVIITMVTDSPDVEQVIMGPNGVIEGVRSGSTVIDMSTISPEVTRQIAGKLAERGVEMLDAPVSGGDQGAIAGTLSIMVGGKREVFDRCQPVFEAMGKKIVHCGGHGAGQTVKLCNQIAVCLTNLATCETMVFATKMGVDPAVMLDALGGGAAASWQLLNLGPRMARRDFAPGFMVRLQQKDIRLILESARAEHLPLPGVSLVHQLFAGVEADGGGDEGTQALVKSLEKLGHVQVGAPAKD